MKTDDFRRIFRSSFPDPEPWQRWFFSSVVREDDIYLATDASGRAASALLMQPYSFRYRGRILDSAYISCVATLPEARSTGLSSGLMRRAIADARTNGTALLSLIPAEDHLYAFYSRFGFESDYFADEMRYTALHNFDTHDAAIIPADYATLSALEEAYGEGIVHSATDYARVCEDLALDPASERLAVELPNGDRAILFATYSPTRLDSEVKVKALLSDSDAAAEAALAQLRIRTGERPFLVNRPPLSNVKFYMRHRGMMRIVSPEPVLQALAASEPSLRSVIRLYDEIIAENNADFEISGGTVRRLDSRAAKCDLEVHIDTLTGIIFGSRKIGSIFGLPATRPYMALMLD